MAGAGDVELDEDVEVELGAVLDRLHPSSTGIMNASIALKKQERIGRVFAMVLREWHRPESGGNCQFCQLPHHNLGCLLRSYSGWRDPLRVLEWLPPPRPATAVH